MGINLGCKRVFRSLANFNDYVHQKYIMQPNDVIANQTLDGIHKIYGSERMYIFHMKFDVPNNSFFLQLINPYPKFYELFVIMRGP